MQYERKSKTAINTKTISSLDGPLSALEEWLSVANDSRRHMLARDIHNMRKVFFVVQGVLDGKLDEEHLNAALDAYIAQPGKTPRTPASEMQAGAPEGPPEEP